MNHRDVRQSWQDQFFNIFKYYLNQNFQQAKTIKQESL